MAGGAGAKGKYREWITPEGLEVIRRWARDGATDKQIAENIGINPKTIYDWTKRFPELSDALKESKAVVDAKVENALLRRALGYETEEIQEEIAISEDGKKTKKTRRTKKQMAPDVTAQIFWLKNRHPEKWRDVYKQEVEVARPDPYDELSTEELRELIRLEQRNEATSQAEG